MKGLLFALVSRSNYLISNAIMATAEFLVFVNSEIGQLLLKNIDELRYNHAVSVTEQQDDIEELEVLSLISQEIDSAVANGFWTEANQYNINNFANVLFNNYDWEQDVVQETIGKMIANANEVMEKKND